MDTGNSGRNHVWDRCQEFVFITHAIVECRITIGQQERHPGNSFNANAVRLRLHALAYNFANFLRTMALPVEVEWWSMTTPHDRVVRIGAKIVRHSRSITF